MTTEAIALNNTNNNNDLTDSNTSSVRKRTRATAEQLSVLEDTFAANVSPNSKLRKELSERLQMSERSIQIWFQNRRAKVKHMQKRAQMQMQQASIRAQLYHYHQQQYGMQPYGGTPIMPLPQHQQHQLHQQQQQQVYPRVPLPRSSSVSSSSTPPASSTSTATIASSSPSSSSSIHSELVNNSIPPSHHLSYPLQDNVDFPDYLHGPLSPSLSPHHDYSTISYPTESSSSIPTLVAVPDAGPTAMLATSSSSSSPSSTSSSPSTSAAISDHLVSTPSSLVDQVTVSPQDIWPSSLHHAHNVMRSQSVSVAQTRDNACSDLPHLERSLSNPPVTTIDPSNLMMNSTTSPSPINASNNVTSLSDVLLTDQQQISSSVAPALSTSSSSSTASSQSSAASSSLTSSSSDVYLNCTTLTIGTWHRLKLRVSDLLCVFKDNVFQWRIEDAGCHFKMEIPLSSVASIEFVEDSNVLADVHFDISESPLFYMETTTTVDDTSVKSWVQCSDFTEGKQASRFFRHSLKGVSQHLKQDLMTLMEQCPETRRWVRFVEPVFTPQHHQHHHHHQTSTLQKSSYPSHTPSYYYPQQPLTSPSSQPYYSAQQYPLQESMTMAPSASPTMAFSSSMYIPPTPVSYWSSMYQMSPSQTPMMMGAPNYLV